jgi:hypothetical protein
MPECGRVRARAGTVRAGRNLEGESRGAVGLTSASIYEEVMDSKQEAVYIESVHKQFEFKLNSNSRAWGCGAFANTGFDVLI